MKDLIYKLLFGIGYCLFAVCHIGNKRTVFMQLLLLITISVSAQDHLIPSDYEINSDNKEDILTSSLLWGFPKKATVRYIVEPSFDANYAFVIIKDSLKYKLLCNKVTVVYDNKKKTRHLFVYPKEREISDSLYYKITRLFNLAVSQSEKTSDPNIGFDGTSYYFTIFKEKGHEKTALIWSPYGKMEELTFFCDCIFNYGYENKPNLIDSIWEQMFSLLHPDE